MSFAQDGLKRLANQASRRHAGRITDDATRAGRRHIMHYAAGGAFRSTVCRSLQFTRGPRFVCVNYSPRTEERAARAFAGRAYDRGSALADRQRHGAETLDTP